MRWWRGTPRLASAGHGLVPWLTVGDPARVVIGALGGRLRWEGPRGATWMRPDGGEGLEGAVAVQVGDLLQPTEATTLSGVAD